jgi:DNA-binding GntR family transcriptional regulator
LAVAHNVSIATAHRAIAVLAAEGLIDVSRGRRATVRAREIPDGMSELGSVDSD